MQPLTRRNLLRSGGLLLGASGVSKLALSAQSRYYIDGLSFVPEHDDLIRDSKLSACIADASKVEIWVDTSGEMGFGRTYQSCLEGLLETRTHISEVLSNAYVARRGSEIGSDGRMGVFLQFQGCEPIEDKLDRIEYFFNQGLRVLQLTHHHNNLFAGGALEATPIGLTELGRDGLREMERVGIIPDVSHASEPTTIDVAKIARRPFILSHGACRAIVDNPRCATDRMIRAVAESGGVMGVFMMSFWLTNEPTPTPEHWLSHVRHIIKIGGIDAAAVANDYPIAGEPNLIELGNDNAEGVKNYLQWWHSIDAKGVPGFHADPRHVVIPEFNTIHRMEYIADMLERSGFTATETDKIIGGNWKRVLTEILG